MAANEDWFPGPRTDQVALGKKWGNRLSATTPPALGVPQAEVDSLEELTTQAETTLDMAKSGDRTTVITAQCREDFGLLENKMRSIKRRFFSELSDVDLVSLGLRPRKESSSVPTPEGFAEADVSYPGVHTLILHLRPVAGQPPLDQRAGAGYRVHWGIMPPGGATVEAATGIKRELMKVPTSGFELPHSRWTRRQKERFNFDGDSGKTVYFCIRYENSKGEVGEFGPIFFAIIP